MSEENLRETYRNDRAARSNLKQTLTDSANMLEKQVLLLILVLSYLGLTIFTTKDAAFIDLDRITVLPLLDLQVPLVGLFVAAPLLLLAIHFHVLFILNQHVKHLLDYSSGCTLEELDLLPASMVNTLPKLHGRRYLMVLFFQWFFLAFLPMAFLVVIQYRTSSFRHLWIAGLQTVVVLADLYLISKFWCAPFPSHFGPDQPGRFGRRLGRLLRGEKQKLPGFMLILGFFSLFNLSGLVLQEHFFERIYETPAGWMARISVDRLSLVRRNIMEGTPKQRLGSEKADLRGRDLTYADLTGSNLSGVDLSDGALRSTLLDNANLEQATLARARGYAASMSGANLRLANLRGADLRRANFSHADLTGADLRQVNLSDANLTGAILNGADLTDANLERASLDRAQAVTALFTGANMVKASLRQGMFQCATFASADLSRADFHFSFAHGVDFMDANLSYASFRFAQLQGAYMGFVRLMETDFGGSEIFGLVFHPLQNPASTTDQPTRLFNLSPAVDQVSRVNWDMVKERQLENLPKNAGSRQPRTFFNTMLAAAVRRSINQTPVRFELYQTDTSDPQQTETQVQKRLTETPRVLRLLTVDLPQILEPLRRRAKAFRALEDRAVILVEGLPLKDLEHAVKTDLVLNDCSQGSEPCRTYQAYVLLPYWIAEHAAGDRWLDLSYRVLTDEDLDFSNIFPLYRHAIACYEDSRDRKRVFAIPLDGDVQLMYYRADLLSFEEVPRTWDAYLALARKINAQADSKVGAFGQVMANSPDDESFYLFWSLVHPFLQTQGMQQGSFFDKENMRPLVDNEAFRTALSLYLQILGEGPKTPDGKPKVLTHEEATRLFMSGQAAMTIDWADLGTYEGFRRHQIKAALMPGSTQVLNRENYRMTPVTIANSPHALHYGPVLVNHAPFAATNGWGGVIPKSEDKFTQDLIYRFFVYMSARAQSQEDVTAFRTGINPYRHSHLHQNTAWQSAKLSPEFLPSYLGAMQDSLENPNLVMDLQLGNTYHLLNEGFRKFIFPRLIATLPDSAQDEALQREVCRELAAFMSQEIATQGKDAQMKAFRQSLNLTPCPCVEDEHPCNEAPSETSFKADSNH